ncbi:MAG TPA: hypothetical protein VGG39_14475 [Polyangiaceae bacterium]|jgi:hypothetical protein
MRLRVVLSCAGAATVLVLIGFALRNTASPHRSAAGSDEKQQGVTAADAPTPAMRVQVTSVDDPRVADLESRLRALEERVPPEAPAGPSAVVPSAGTQEEAERASTLAHERWVDRFRGEGADPSWAPSAQASLQSELHDLGEQVGARVQAVECRTTLCAAEVEWSSFAAVGRSSAELVQHGYTENCAKTIYTPPPDDPTAPYHATLFFDCEQFRTR